MVLRQGDIAAPVEAHDDSSVAHRARATTALAMVVFLIPATLLCFAAFASAAFAGNFFATGHDQDLHCAVGDPDECSYYQITTSFVRGGSNLPVLILDRDNKDPSAPGSNGHGGDLEAVAALNLAYSNGSSRTPTPSSPPYVVEDPQGLQATTINGTAPPGVTASSTWATTPLVDSVGRPLWSAIIIASDENCGGCDLNNALDGSHPDSDAINARTSLIQSFFNAGGGLLYLAGASDSFDADGVPGNDVYYASVPVSITGQPKTKPFTVTPAGAALGITDTMANCCATHNSFSLPGAGSPLQVAETDTAGLAESLFIKGGTVCSAGFCDVAISASGGKSFTGAVQAPVGGTLATFTDPDTSSTASEYSATIDWGDGATSLGTITGSGGNFTVTGSHRYASAHTFTITVTITDVDNTTNNATVTDTATIGNLSSKTTPPAVTPGAPNVHSSTSAAFAGTVNPEGLTTNAHFEYGLDPKYSGGGPIVYNLHTPSHGVGSDFSSHPVSATVQGLVPNAVYHVRLVASNSAGQTVGPDQTFKTKKDREPGPPVLGKTFDASVVHGLVLIKFPPGKGPHAAFKKGQGFIPLTEPRQLPVGTEVDSRRGTLNVTTATVKIGKHKAKPQTGTVSGAIFKVSQSRAKLQKGLTTLRILENAFRGAPSTSKCTVKGAADTGAHAARLSRRTLQTLHYRGHGHFSVRGRYSVGVELGTVFNTTDRCDATLTVVKRGAVKVTDLIRHKTIIVHAGHSYLAKAIKKRKHG